MPFNEVNRTNTWLVCVYGFSRINDGKFLNDINIASCGKNQNKQKIITCVVESSLFEKKNKIAYNVLLFEIS